MVDKLGKIILASGSARRVEILNAVNWPFETSVAGIDESVEPDEDPVKYVKRLARSKAEAVAARYEEGLVLGADTTVVVDEMILGQPADDAEARRMLQMLSGKWHEVLTGVCFVRIGSAGKTIVDHTVTRVRFSEMSDEEIDWYVSTKEPMGKAGAYGIQGRAALFVKEIEGEYLNIVGLPIRLVYEMWATATDFRR
ncbi:MAG: nucleoside triphosphate pyrophosphatase [Pyrinomonadaceae bacterium]